jgi:molecular chaperone GrpE
MYEAVEETAAHEAAARNSLSAALRELEAAKMRVERDARAVADEMRRDLVERLLPVLDDLDRTINAAEAAGDAPTVIEGVLLVRSHVERVLHGYGLERVEALGEPFDPRIHEAVATVPVAQIEQHEIVVDQFAPGYRFNGSLLRPAKVVVGLLRT